MATGATAGRRVRFYSGMDDDRRLVDFFGGGVDDQGRTHAGILAWDDERLELVHDYIQWIFPLPERSGANPRAPVLSAATIATIRGNPEMQARLRAAFLRMLAFYGFAWRGEAVVEGTGFAAAAQNWLHPENHNHLRLTRMLRSLRVLGLEQEATMLWRMLKDVSRQGGDAGRPRITDRTLAFWDEALR